VTRASRLNTAVCFALFGAATLAMTQGRHRPARSELLAAQKLILMYSERRPRLNRHLQSQLIGS